MCVYVLKCEVDVFIFIELYIYVLINRYTLYRHKCLYFVYVDMYYYIVYKLIQSKSKNILSISNRCEILNLLAWQLVSLHYSGFSKRRDFDTCYHFYIKWLVETKKYNVKEKYI